MAGKTISVILILCVALFAFWVHNIIDTQILAKDTVFGVLPISKSGLLGLLHKIQVTFVLCGIVIGFLIARMRYKEESQF